MVEPVHLTRAKLKNLTPNKMEQEEIKKLSDRITQNLLFCVKDILTSNEAAEYMGVSKSYLYKLTMKGEIPHYKPMGKMCYFNRSELEQWLQQNRCATGTEIADQAQRYIFANKH